MTEEPKPFAQWRARTSESRASKRGWDDGFSRALLVGVLSLPILLTAPDPAMRLLAVAVLVLAAELATRVLWVRRGLGAGDRRFLVLRAFTMAVGSGLVVVAMITGGAWYGVALLVLATGDLVDSPSLLKWLWGRRTARTG